VKRLTPQDLLDVETYQSVRPEYRPRLLAHKQTRRIGIGEHVTLLFEDRETVRYQILEMARVEGARTPEQIQIELDVYNELVPGRGELCATLFIEIPDLESIRPELDRLIGIDECVQLVLGEPGAEQVITADFDRRQLQEDRISAVHYLRFRLSDAQIAQFSQSSQLAAGTAARLRVDHSEYRHEVEIPASLQRSLLEDLQGDGAVLLDPSAANLAAAPRDEILRETATLRAYRPAQPLGPEHIIVEPKQAIPSLLEADPKILSELLEVVQQLAREVKAKRGRCRVWSDIDPAEPKLRWQIAAPRD
jgi:hypothetical protein